MLGISQTTSVDEHTIIGRKEELDMNSTTQSRVASVLTVLVGAWVMMIPAFTTVTGNAFVNLMIVGGVIALAGLVQLFWENALPSWVNGLAAVWLLVTAFTFDVSTAVAWNMIFAAVVAFMLALWDGIEVNESYRMHHQNPT